MEPDDKTAVLKTTLIDGTLINANVMDDKTAIVKTTIIDDKTQLSEHNTATEAAPSGELSSGAIIKDRFILKEPLGAGGMGQVYRAVDLRREEANDDNPYIAIKLLSNAFSTHPAAFVTLQREAKKTQTLAHPNIVTVYDFDRDGATIYMTMEELKGVSLDKVISQAKATPLEFKKAVKMIRDIAVGLSYAHTKGFIHSDLKPGNIFFTDKGQIKILDFGIARAVGLEQNTDAFDAASLGALTPKYASLEMFEGAQPDPRDDIYALGIIACELLGGGHPYRGKTALQLDAAPMAPQLPKKIGRLLRRLLQASVMPRAKDRTASVEKFIKQLDFATGGYKKAVAALVVAIAVGIGNLVYWYYFDDSYPALSTLPIAQQQLFHSKIQEANGALAAGDVNGALFYLDDAYAIHKRDKDIDTISKQILTLVKKSATNADGSFDTATYNQVLEALKEHPVFKDKNQ